MAAGVERGKVDREDLIGPPFTNINPQGIRGVFPANQLSQVLSLIETIGQLAP